MKYPIDHESRRPGSWDSPAFRLAPVAPATGPFPYAKFLRTTTTADGEEPAIFESEDGLVALVRRDGRLEMAGDADFCDYHTPLGPGSAELVAEVVGGTSKGVAMRFDSLPEEAASVMAAGMTAGGVEPAVEVHTSCAVLSLPSSFDDYLTSLSKKQRHETRRKLRRFEQEIGSIRVEEHQGSGWAFEQFVRLHRLAGGEKGRFMDDRTQARFAGLLEDPAWSVQVLWANNKVVAGLFGATDSDAYYLYNSGYDPEFAGVSPGLVAVLASIRHAIGKGLSRFDFLKGDEPYKYRLGAIARPLYEVRGAR